MARTVIARVRLAPSEVGFYDELSRIHLTMTSPEADIFSGMNCAHIKRAVGNGTLRLVSGSFCLPETEKKKVITPVIKAKPVKKMQDEEPKPAPAAEVFTADAEPEEATVAENATAELQPKRRSRKQKVAEPVADSVVETVAEVEKAE